MTDAEITERLLCKEANAAGCPFSYEPLSGNGPADTLGNVVQTHTGLASAWISTEGQFSLRAHQINKPVDEGTQ